MKLAYLETDASVDTRREVVGLEGRLFPAGAGIILRDIALRPALSKSIPLGGLPGPVHAEYFALTLGLEEALDLGIRGVWASSDCERLVDAFHRRSVNDSPGLAAIEERLRAAAGGFEFVTLRWSPGSHRKLKFGGPSADALARAAVGLGRRR